MSNKNHKNLRQKIVDMRDVFFLGTLASALSPYVLPTVIQKVRRDMLNGEREKNSNVKIRDPKTIGAGLGIGTGITMDVVSAVDYWNHPEFLLLPLATNIASGLYEVSRYIHN